VDKHKPGDERLKTDTLHTGKVLFAAPHFDKIAIETHDENEYVPLREARVKGPYFLPADLSAKRQIT